MWPASASSARELISSAVVSSRTKNAVRIPAAMTIRLTRVSRVAVIVSGTHASNLCVKTHISQGRRQNQADQNRVSSLPSADQRRGTPDRSKNQYTTPKNHWFTCGANSRSSRMKNAHCLAGCQRALRLGAQVRLERAVAVQAGDRQQVQHAAP